MSSCAGESYSATCVLSTLDPGHHVVQEEEDQDHAHRHVAKNAAVVTARADHSGETFDAARQQAGGAQKVGVLVGVGGTETGNKDSVRRRMFSRWLA